MLPSYSVGLGSGATLSPVSVVPDLVVDVIGAQAADHHADEGLADGHPLEVALGVVGGPLGAGLGREARAPQQLADVVEVGVGRGPGGAVAVVGHQHALPHLALDLLVDHHQHDPIQVQGFALRGTTRAYQCHDNRLHHDSYSN